MKATLWRGTPAAALLASLIVTSGIVVSSIVASTGCARSRTTSDAPAASAPSDSSSTTPGDARDQASSRSKLEPAATIPGIWTQIAGEQTRVADAIASGQLGAVHTPALRIRDLVVAIAAKADSLTPADSTRLVGLVEQAQASATQVAERSVANDLRGAKTEYGKLEALLITIHAVPGLGS